MAAGAAERQGPVLLPLDLVEHVQDGHAFLDLHLMGFVVGLFVLIGIEPKNFEGLGHGFFSLELMISQEIHQNDDFVKTSRCKARKN
jgi:hypothetical protein